MNGVGIGMTAVITAHLLKVTREGPLQALTACCAAAVGTAAPTICGALGACVPLRLKAAELSASVASAMTIKVIDACLLLPWIYSCPRLM